VADPPDNLGLGYGEYDDNLDQHEYNTCLLKWLWAFKCAADIVWVSFNARWWMQVGRVTNDILRCCPDYEAKLFIQSFTFGQNNKHDCGNGYRPLLRLKHCDASIYPEAVKVPSARSVKYADKRAAPGGCVPLDVWDFPRVCGTFKQRRRWHPTQLHEELIERIIKFSTLPGDTICDCFSGTGTVLRAVDNISSKGEFDPPRNPVTSIELDAGYCGKIADEHGLTVETLREEAA
jgi:site-specific DNA-methyltransferase (adenine-specific)